MYAVYRKHMSGDYERFEFKRQGHIFGCNKGVIPKMLRELIDSDAGEPLKWHVPIGTMLAQNDEAFVIDLKPNNPDKGNSLSLYEFVDSWGYSAYGWTPAMFRLRGLCVDGEPEIQDPRDFKLPTDDGEEPIYSFLYFAGSVKSGALQGPWTAPRASPTNSALLWPYALGYFYQVIGEVSPKVLEMGASQHD